VRDVGEAIEIWYNWRTGHRLDRPAIWAAVARTCRYCQGCVAPVNVATGNVQNRIIFKQLFQANAIGFVRSIAAGWAASTDTIVLLMAAKFGASMPTIPGSTQRVLRRLSLFVASSVSASLENRVLEYVDHLQYFLDPVVIRNGHVPPTLACCGVAL